MRRLKQGLTAAAFVGLVILLWSVWDRSAVVALGQQLHPLTFFGAAAVLPALGVPFTPLFLVAGANFGAALGIAVSLAALAVNLALSYWLARSALRPRLESALRRFGYDVPDVRGGPVRPVRFAVMVKLAPGVPGFVKHYALGLAAVPFHVYMTVSLLSTGAYASAAIALGDSLFAHDVGRGSAVIVAALGVGGLLWWWRRRVRRSRRQTPRHRTSSVRFP